MIKNIKETLCLLTVKEKNFFFYLVVLMLIGSLLEAIGLGLIIPFISVIIDIENFKLLNFIPSSFSSFILSLGFKERVLFFSFLILFFYFIKNLFIAWLNYKINMFAFNTRAQLGNRLFNLYLSKDYKFFMGQNSSKLTNNIHNEANVYCEAALISTLTILTEALLILTITLILIIYNPPVTLIVFFTIFLFSALFQFLTKPLISKWGKMRQEADEDRFKILSQGFGGIRELKIFNKLNFFKEKFNIKNNLLGRVSGYHSTMQGFPKLYLEMIAIVSFVIIIVTITYTSNNISNLITILSLYGVAAFRMLPSANKVIHSQQNLRFATPSLERLRNEFYQFSNNSGEMKKEDHITENLNWNKISFNKVNFLYEEKGKKIFNDLNFIINKGDKIGILGETGAGKSTFFDLFCGLIDPTSGEILLDKRNISTIDKNLFLKKFGYVSQSIFLFDDTIGNNIRFNLEDKNEQDNNAINKVLKIAKLEDFIYSLDAKLNTKIGERGIKLSGGQRQRIGIARALYNDPEILILDEATNALDADTEKQIVESIDNHYKDKTIIYISHNLNTLKKCDIIYEIKNSNIEKIK
jgi:ABC-type multidrug transport system fused ATPase/permease subunit